MPNTSIDLCEKLAGLLKRFFKIVEREQLYSWQVLKQTVVGKTGYFLFDNCFMMVHVPDTDPLELIVEPQNEPADKNFISSAETVRNIIDGHLTLDTALSTGKIFVRGSLVDLLRMYNLVMNILADGAISRSLRLLWHEFDQQWPASNADCDPMPFEAQAPEFGTLIKTISISVLNPEIE